MVQTTRKQVQKLDVETELLEQARKGNRQALNQLVSLYWQLLYRYIYYKIRHKEEAEELTQETLLKAVVYLPKFEERGIPFRSFVMRIATNLVTDHWRKKARGGDALPLTEAVVLTNDVGPDELAILEERRTIVHQAIDTLPEEQKKVIQLRLLEGKSVKEAADLMKKTEGALKMLQQRALQNIRKRIEGRIG
jgi:RNA polymerase sigma-70 factor (ECF subfamily)